MRTPFKPTHRINLGGEGLATPQRRLRASWACGVMRCWNIQRGAPAHAHPVRTRSNGNGQHDVFTEDPRSVRNPGLRVPPTNCKSRYFLQLENFKLIAPTTAEQTSALCQKVDECRSRCSSLTCASSRTPFRVFPGTNRSRRSGHLFKLPMVSVGRSFLRVRSRSSPRQFNNNHRSHLIPECLLRTGVLL